jgi:hypothetical protein
MIFTPISKETAESRRNAIRLKRPGYGSPPYWRNVNPWSLSPDAGYHGDSSNDSQLSRLIDSIMETGAVYLPKKSVSNLETNAPAGEMETLFFLHLNSFCGMVYTGAGIAQSRSPQAGTISVFTDKKKQGSFPWFNLAGTPGLPGKWICSLIKFKHIMVDY